MPGSHSIVFEVVGSCTQLFSGKDHQQLCIVYNLHFTTNHARTDKRNNVRSGERLGEGSHMRMDLFLSQMVARKKLAIQNCAMICIEKLENNFPMPCFPCSLIGCRSSRLSKHILHCRTLSHPQVQIFSMSNISRSSVLHRHFSQITFLITHICNCHTCEQALICLQIRPFVRDFPKLSASENQG